MSGHDAWSPSNARHPVNAGNLVIGIALLGLVAVWALVKADLVADETIRYLLPMPWVLGGVAGLVASTLASRRRAAQRARGEDPY